MLDLPMDNLAVAGLAVVFGLGLLLFAGDLLVRGSVALALKFQIPPMVIGLTIVAFGTSAPELFIGVQSVFSGNVGIALGNVVGSNIANVLLVLGIPSMIYPTICKQPAIRRNTVIMIGATLMFIYMARDAHLSFANGVTMLILLLAYLGYWANHTAKKPGMDPLADELTDIDGIDGLPKSGLAMLAFVGLGLIGLPLGAKLMVDGGVSIAEYLQVDEALIGLTLIAVGTSLPELATTVVAAMRRHSGLAIGNVIGSNLFNLFGVMGVTTLVAGERGIEVDRHLIDFDFWVMLGAAMVLVPFAFRHRPITRAWGFVFLLLYLAYIVLIFDVTGP